MGLQSPKGKFLDRKLKGRTVTKAVDAPKLHAVFQHCAVISLYHFWTSPLSNWGSQLLRIKWCLFYWQKAQWPTHVINGSHCLGNIAIEIFLNVNELISVSMLIVTQFLLFLNAGELFLKNKLLWIKNISHEYINSEFQEPLILFI